jgi:hypothetical protein
MRATRRGILANSLLALLLTSASVHADLLSVSDPRFGSGALTLDTTTGLAWLDLPFSAGLSYQQMLAALQPGGSFEGFRYATAQEVGTLFISAGIPGPGWYPESSSSLQPIIALVTLLGPTSSQDGRPEVGAVTSTWGRLGLMRPSIDFMYRNGGAGYSVSGFPNPVWEFGETTPDSSWLVTLVPEPGVAMIAVVGSVAWLASLCRGRRHIRSAQLMPRERPRLNRALPTWHG